MTVSAWSVNSYVVCFTEWPLLMPACHPVRGCATGLRPSAVAQGGMSGSGSVLSGAQDACAAVRSGVRCAEHSFSNCCSERSDLPAPLYSSDMPTSLHSLLLTLAAASLSTAQPDHHPNSVYSQINKHTSSAKKSVKIFYQTGVSQYYQFHLILPTVLNCDQLTAEQSKSQISACSVRLIRNTQPTNQKKIL